MTMPTTFTSSIISASAGTGKTYQLATRFIALLALGEAPESMIALTFARKAAHEFRERILKDLAAGASGDAGAAALADRIRKAWHGNEGAPPLAPGIRESNHPLDKQAFTLMLQRVVAAMARTRLSTLDSFFTSILSSGRAELGVGQFAQIGEEEMPGIIRRVTDTMLYEISQDQAAAESFSEIIEALAGEDKLTPHQAFAKFVYAFLDEFVDGGCNTELWGNHTAFNLPAPCCPEKRSLAKRQEITAALNNAYGGNPPGKLATAVGKVIAGKLPNKEEFLALQKAAAESGESAGALAATLSQLEEETRQLALWQCVTRSRALAGFLMKYFQYYTADVTNCGKFGYSDITRRIPILLEGDGARERLDYRLDNRYRHWMLDEFQDTSEIQWRALKPLTENLVSETAAAPDRSAERSLFVVGDIKQSIYQWRGGKPSIFKSLLTNEPWCRALQPVDMNRSWRSAPCIMDFVNRTFRDFPQVKEHRSAPPLQNAPGYVGLYTCSNGRKTPTPQACEIIREILESLPIGEKQMSVGIIVRKNDTAGQIYEYLKQHFGDTLPIYLDGLAQSVVNNPLGEVLLAFFRWLAHPADSYREAEFKTSPLGACMQGGELLWSHWQQETERGGYAAVLRCFKEKLAANGFVLSQHHEAVLDLCIREAIAFDARGGTTADWITRLENLSCAVVPPKHAVHIITIHRSKGLEYDAVILPFIQVPAQSAFFLSNNVDRLNAPDGSILVPQKQGASALAAMWPQLQASLDTAEQAANEAGLNELYVALTRAAYANYIIMHASLKPGNNSFGGIIKNSLPDSDAGQLANTGFLEYGEKDWFLTAGLKDRPAPERGDAAPVVLPKAAPRRSRKSPSKAHDATIQENEMPQSAPHTEDGFAPAEFGTLVHALFEQVGHCGNAPLPPWATAPANDAQRVVAKALQQPDIRALLSPPPGSLILREQPVEAVSGGSWTSAVIDRLTLFRHGESVTGAHIVDYKTDRRGDAEPQEQDAALVERHAPQLAAYRDLVCRAFSLPREKVSATLLSCPREGEARLVQVF